MDHDFPVLGAVLFFPFHPDSQGAGERSSKPIFRIFTFLPPWRWGWRWVQLLPPPGRRGRRGQAGRATVAPGTGGVEGRGWGFELCFWRRLGANRSGGFSFATRRAKVTLPRGDRPLSHPSAAPRSRTERRSG